MLGFGLDSWNNMLVGSLVLAALAAAFVGVATYVVIRLQRVEETATKEEFERYKIEASERISGAEARASEAQLALEQFKAPRAITGAHFALFVNQLAPFKGAGIDIVLYGETSEIIGISTVIFKGLVQAGWKVPPVRFAVGGGVWAAIPGIRIMLRENADDEVKTAADTLASILNDVGVPTVSWSTFGANAGVPAVALSGEPINETTVNPIRMYIGPKQ
jgi:hypothetical protein